MRATPVVSDGLRRALLVSAALGSVAFAVALALAPARAWAGLLANAFYFLTVALGAAVFLALGHVSNTGWTTVLKRVPEAFCAFLPVGGLAMGSLVFGLGALYPWAGDGAAHDPLLEAKGAYLNAPFFLARMAAVIFAWWLFAAALRRHSLRQDADGSVLHTRRSVAVSAVFLIVFGFTFSMASIDWLMSLTPHWMSTIFGLYNIGGLLSGSVAAIAVGTIALRRAGLLPGVGPSHLHDLGKLLFAFTTLWAYLWFSQYLLIWYANLPEETAYFLERTSGGWALLFYLNPVLGWALPFLLLLPRPAKRSESHLFRVCLLVLAARWLDVYLMVAPAVAPEHPGLGVAELAPLLGLGALFALVVGRALAAAPLVPKGDPYLVESLSPHP
jgi:hypothetical protein